MSPAAAVAFLWLLFGGTHVGLAAMRPRLVARVGEIGFVIIFYVIAVATFTALVTYYAGHRFDGAVGLALGAFPLVRWVLMAVAFFGLVLTAPALIAYPRLPSALFDQPIGETRGIERITRHPFFAGAALFAVVHALLATHLVGTVFFVGLVLLATLGAWHQDRKLMARRGRAYVDYCSSTSVIPFAAILAGRQRLVWRELPLRGLALGVALACAARYGHDRLFAGSGLWIVAVFVVGSMAAGINAWRRSRRLSRTMNASSRGPVRSGSPS